MQNDWKNIISMNSSYTLLRLNIISLESSSWAGKYEPYWFHTGTAQALLQSLFQNRDLISTVLSDTQEKQQQGTKRLPAQLLDELENELHINLIFFHSSNKHSYTSPFLSHYTFQHISHFPSSQPFSPL